MDRIREVDRWDMSDVSSGFKITFPILWSTYLISGGGGGGGKAIRCKVSRKDDR